MSRDWDIVDDDADDATRDHGPPSDALDARRIHSIVAERRAANRARLRRATVAPVSLGLALMAAIRAAMAWPTSRAFAIACAATAAVTAVIAWRAWQASARRNDVSPPATPQSPPTFEGLGGDGDAASRLARLRDGH